MRMDTRNSTPVAPQCALHPDGPRMMHKDPIYEEPVGLFSFDYGYPPDGVNKKKAYSPLDAYGSHNGAYMSNTSTTSHPPRNMPFPLYDS